MRHVVPVETRAGDFDVARLRRLEAEHLDGRARDQMRKVTTMLHEDSHLVRKVGLPRMQPRRFDVLFPGKRVRVVCQPGQQRFTVMLFPLFTDERCFIP